jgi:hypothetical protein
MVGIGDLDEEKVKHTANDTTHSEILNYND